MEPALTTLRGQGFTSSSKPDWGSFIATKQDRLLGFYLGGWSVWNAYWVKAITNHMCQGNWWELEGFSWDVERSRTQTGPISGYWISLILKYWDYSSNKRQLTELQCWQFKRSNIKKHRNNLSPCCHLERKKKKTWPNSDMERQIGRSAPLTHLTATHCWTPEFPHPLGILSWFSSDMLDAHGGRREVESRVCDTI